MKQHIAFDLAFRKNPYPGKFIVIEGIDGSGKSTQIKVLAEKLQAAGKKVVTTKEPTDMVIGKFVREEILSGKTKIPPIALQYLFNADRVMHLEEIESLLKNGTTVLMDRYFWSSVAYAIADLQVDLDWSLTAFSILSFYNQFLLPDFSFLLQLSADEALFRIEETGKKTEIYETQEKLSKIEKSYSLLQQKFPEEFIVIDAKQEKAKITEEMLAKIQL